VFALFQLSPAELLALGAFVGVAILAGLALVGFLLFLSRRRRPPDD